MFQATFYGMLRRKLVVIPARKVAFARYECTLLLIASSAMFRARTPRHLSCLVVLFWTIRAKDTQSAKKQNNTELWPPKLAVRAQRGGTMSRVHGARLWDKRTAKTENDGNIPSCCPCPPFTQEATGWYCLVCGIAHQSKTFPNSETVESVCSIHRFFLLFGSLRSLQSQSGVGSPALFASFTPTTSCGSVLPKHLLRASSLPLRLYKSIILSCRSA